MADATIQITRPNLIKTMGISILDKDTISICISRPGARSLHLNLYPENGAAKHINIPSLKDLGMTDFFSVRIHNSDLMDELKHFTYDFTADGEHFLNTSAEIVSGRDVF